MDLFTVNNGKVVPSAEALTISPYKDIWAKDTSPEKSEAINVFSYATFLLSPKKSNPFFGYPQGDLKKKKIKHRIWGDENYNSDLYSILEIIQVVESYKLDLENSSPSYGVLIDAIETAHKTRDYLRDVDLGATNLHGTLMLKPKDVTGALKEIPDIIRTLEDTRDRVLSEQKESAKSRNNREIGFFER
jgi:hypothetical protein